MKAALLDLMNRIRGNDSQQTRRVNEYELAQFMQEHNAPIGRPYMTKTMWSHQVSEIASSIISSGYATYILGSGIGIQLDPFRCVLTACYHQNVQRFNDPDNYRWVTDDEPNRVWAYIDATPPQRRTHDGITLIDILGDY